MSERKEFIDTVMNLSKFHKEHERYYSRTPLVDALEVQRISNALKTLANRWEDVKVAQRSADNRYAGCEDLNVLSSVKEMGVLFMEGEGEPREIAKMKRYLGDLGEEYEDAGAWLSAAMESSWGTVAALIRMPALSDVLGERHRIIANDWQAAHLDSLIGRLLGRARMMLDHIDFAPEALRRDLSENGTAPRLIHSCTELLDRVSDLMCESAMLVHDNDRRWLVFRERVASILGDEG